MNDLALNQPRDNLPSHRRGYLTQQLQQQPQSLAPEQFGLQDLIRIFERHKLLILGIVAAVTLATLAWQLLSPNLYQAQANIQVELIDDTGTNQADILARNTQRLANESKLYRSRNSVRTVVETLGLHEDPDFHKEMGGAPSGSEADQINSAVSTLLGMTRVESENGSDLIELTATARSPEMAAQIANAFPAAVRDLKRTRSEERRQELLDDLGAERAERVDTAKEAADALAEFRVQNRMLVGAGGTEDLAQINRIAAEAASATARGAGASAASAGVASAASIRSTAGATNAAVQQLQRQQAQLSAELASLTQTYGDGYPEVARVRSELQTVESNLSREQDAARAAAQEQANAESARMAQLARADAARDQARAGQLQSVVASLTSKAYQNASNTPLLEQLEREAVTSAQAVAEVAERITRVRSEKLVEGVTSNIISPATANNEVVSPSPLKTTLIALIGSAILGLIIAFLIDMLDDRLRTVAQIRRQIRKAHVEFVDGRLRVKTVLFGQSQ
ncbi:MAG: Wzz/FepE/Etk N-terminal domain-containing protein [Pseudomonadota bacterium]